MPIESYGLMLESRLDAMGLQVFKGSPRQVASSDGRFCRIPTQEAHAYRLAITAAGHSTYQTDWLQAGLNSSIDLGEISLGPRQTRSVLVRVLDADTGSVVSDASVLSATFELEKEDLILAGERVVLNPSHVYEEDQVQALRTNAQGEVQVDLPTGAALWLAAWKEPFQVSVVDQPAMGGSAWDGPVFVDIELAGGPGIEGAVVLGSGLRSVIQGLSLDVRAPGIRRQLPLEVTSDELIPFQVRGLSPGLVEVWVVAQESGNQPIPIRTLIAAHSVVLAGSETAYVQLECGVSYGAGVVSGSVSLPSDLDLVSLRAFASSDRTSPLAHRTVPVINNEFMLSGCEGTQILFGVQGYDASAAIQVLWVGQIDGTTNPSLTIDLNRSVVRGRAGDLSHLAMEEILVSPMGNHPLAGIPLATVTVYPQADGEFSIYGLEPGPYRAVGAYSGLSAEFLVESGVVDVLLRH